jgi:dTDP-4-amino-4,6-dideoxygalactose transaminase
MLMTATRQLAFGRPMIDAEERNAVLEVLSGPILVHGPRAAQFEADFAAMTGAPQAVSVSSCTAGMHLVWFALGLREGDEVIVPAMTHVATAHAVALVGATPVFVDAEAATGNIDLAAVEAAITSRTRAIAVVHYLGMPVEMPKIMEIARRHRLFVLEDCALAIGSTVKGTHAGLLGDCGVFSFYPVKHITTAEGGMIILKDQALADKLRLAKAFGVDRTHGERKVPGVYDVTGLGFNYRMSEIHAAIGIAQVKKVPDFLARRRANYAALAQGLADVGSVGLLASTHDGLTSSHYCLAAMLVPKLAGKRADIMARLTALGVGTSVYYPHPLPRLTYYAKKSGWRDGSFPQAERLADASIALPVGPHLGVEDMNYIARSLKTVVEGIGQ